MASTLPGLPRLRGIVPLPQPRPNFFRVVLALRPTAEAITYAIRSEWTEFVAGKMLQTPLEKMVALRISSSEDRWHVSLHTSGLRLGTPSATFFDETGLLLAELYAGLVLEVAPTGTLLAIANSHEVHASWARVQQELQRRYPAPSEMLETLVAGVNRQLAHPAGLRPSLGYDYMYAALVGDFYQQSFDTWHQYLGTSVFPEFFDGLALTFTETLRLAPGHVPGQVLLHLTGAIDGATTNLMAIAECIQAALQLPAAIALAEVRFAYRATHCLDPSTGLPTSVVLTVSCTYQDLYRKEYHLTIEAISSTLLPHLP